MIDAPQIDFPAFPVPPAGAVVYDDETGTVTMPLDYFTRIYEYKVRVDEAQAVYNGIKAIGGKDAKDS